MRKRKLAPIDHSPVRDLTLDDYLRARDLVAAGKTQAEVTRVCEISGPQYWHLWRYGFPARSAHEAQPSFERYLAEQLSTTRKAGQEAAAAVGVRGVQVLSRQVENAAIANDLANLLLRCQQERLQEWLAMPDRPRPALDAYMLGDDASKLLHTLHKWADLTRPAAAFDRLYDLNVGEQWAHRRDDLPGTIDTDARERLPAALSSRAEIAGGDAGKTFQLVEAAKTFEGWTQEEIEHYAETGEDPPGKG